MKSFKQWNNITGWVVFAIALTVYFFSAERVGSLWDCGEFIAGAYKLEVVHPPGAPLFLIIGRIFALIAETFSDQASDIAFSVNLLSSLCTAFTAMLVCWVTTILGRLALEGREGELDMGQNIVLLGSGVIAGLTTAFASSIWFSAVEGEVYAMSTFFTALTLWATMKWYQLPDDPKNDHWLIFAVYSAGLSLGVHLLSLLTFPALAIFYYYKKYENHNWLGVIGSAAVGLAMIVAIQTLIIVGIPKLWSSFELLMVNSFGLPYHTGLIPTLLIVAAVIGFGLRYAHQKKYPMLQMIIVGATMIVIGFSTIGVIVLRANANPPINMNDPSDAMRLIPYLNREQYGERALFRGPTFDARPIDTEVKERYGQVDGKYEVVDNKVSYEYRNSDKIFFPRMGDYTQNRPALYQEWMKSWGAGRNSPNAFDNFNFLVRYQLGWMYWRYFMWNFSGRQNGEQGYFSWDLSSGHWLTGIEPLDEARLYEMDELPESAKEHEARNQYFMLPFLFGLFGLLFHFQKRPSEAFGLLALFIITGIGIIIYSNQPPNEPRERDYVLAGSFFTYAIWIGMGALAFYDLMRDRLNLSSSVAGSLGVALVLAAPLLMGFQNFDDHSRMHHTGARDYASNFLESCEENAIIFTYGDNDTYPLWYAQEVEGIRTDVRVVNLSLIAVDWYIDQLRRKVNDSPPIKMTIPSEAYRGFKRVQTPYYNPRQPQESYNPALDQEMSVQQVLQHLATDKPLNSTGSRSFDTYLPTKRMYIPVDKEAVYANNVVSPRDTNLVDRLPVKFDGDFLIKDDMAILDILGSNLWERPIYFAVTCQPSKMFGLQNYMQLEGLGLRVIPVQSQSDQIYGVIGSGRVAMDEVYENVMDEFRWGGFNEHDLFVDRSYGPSVQSHRLLMLRTAREMLDRGDDERAIEMVEKYLEVFPHMNFPYDLNTMYFLDVLVQADAYEKAKPHLRILAEETADHMEFYFSIGDDIERGFEQDFSSTVRTKDQILQTVQQAGDEEFLNELKELFAPFEVENLPG